MRHDVGQLASGSDATGATYVVEPKSSDRRPRLTLHLLGFLRGPDLADANGFRDDVIICQDVSLVLFLLFGAVVLGVDDGSRSCRIDPDGGVQHLSVLGTAICDGVNNSCTKDQADERGGF